MVLNGKQDILDFKKKGELKRSLILIDCGDSLLVF